MDKERNEMGKEIAILKKKIEELSNKSKGAANSYKENLNKLQSAEVFYYFYNYYK